MCARCPLPRFDPGPELRAVVALSDWAYAADGTLREERIGQILDGAGAERHRVAEEIAYTRECRAEAAAMRRAGGDKDGG